MRFVFTLLFLIPFCGYAQPVEFNYKGNQSTCKCKKQDNIIDALQVAISSDTIKDERYLACCYHCLGVQYYREDEYIKANQQYKKAIALRSANGDNELAKSYKNIGYSQKEFGLFYEAISSINLAIQLSDKEKNRASNYRYLGNCYTSIGEFEKAKYSLNIALELVTSDADKARLYNTICFMYAESNSSRETIEYAEKAITLYKKVNSKEGIARAYNNKGIAYMRLKEYNEAIKSYNFATEIYRGKSIFRQAQTLNNIAIVLREQNKYKEAITTLNKSLQLKRKYHENTPYQATYAPNHENLAENYEALGELDKALKNYQLALINLTDNFRNEDVNANPKVANNHYIYNKPYLLQALDLKAQAALKNDNIDLAHDTYQVLDEWINEFYKDLSTKASKLTWIDRAHDTYAHAIEVALAKKDNEKAFEYAEKAHAVLLWQSLSQQAARNLLSKDEQEKIDNLNAQIRQADQQYRNGEIQIDALRTLEREREALEKTFDEKYPAYAQRKYQPETTTVSDIQSNITDDHTAFIEYYQANEVLYIFTITKNGIEITQENAAGLAGDIIDFVNNISGKSEMENDLALALNKPSIPVNLRSNNNVSLKNTDLKSYHALAHKLYQQLIPSAIHSNDKINRLVIVPDREIGMLPFAALTTESTSSKLNKNTPFLVKKYTVNYLYSAGSYLQLQQQKADQRYCFAGIAPVEYQLEGWKKLPHSEGELDGMKPLHWVWQREILKREAATKAEFERIIKEGYRTIQVSTHAVFDKNKGQIIFHDSALNQDEIDQLEINTHRLILSACETGVGTQNQGEGILSLGWNFAYKGVPSITMTHWSVSDNSTKDIMIQYHENLNDGIPADKALQNAQQYYLENIISDSQANPRYWAAIFHTGNVR